MPATAIPARYCLQTDRAHDTGLVRHKVSRNHPRTVRYVLAEDAASAEALFRATQCVPADVPLIVLPLAD